ncbi:MAG: hypothetical protein LKE43_04300 [Olsenella sp.]|nr:hypothetical protein [Olsenella sp.]
MCERSSSWAGPGKPLVQVNGTAVEKPLDSVAHAHGVKASGACGIHDPREACVNRCCGSAGLSHQHGIA